MAAWDLFTWDMLPSLHDVSALSSGVPRSMCSGCILARSYATNIECWSFNGILHSLWSDLQRSTETSPPWASISTTIWLFSTGVIPCHMKGKRRYNWTGSSYFNYWPTCNKCLIFLHHAGNVTIIIGSMLHAWNKLDQKCAVTERTANIPTWINPHWSSTPFW